MALPTIMWAVIRFMAAPTESHVQWLDLPRHNHFLNLTVAEGANFGYVFHLHALVVEDKTLQVLFMREMHEIRKVMHLLPPRWFVLFPIFG